MVLHGIADRLIESRSFVDCRLRSSLEIGVTQPRYVEHRRPKLLPSRNPLRDLLCQPLRRQTAKVFWKITLRHFHEIDLAVFDALQEVLRVRRGVDRFVDRAIRSGLILQL